jgi:hypothetical protein
MSNAFKDKLRRVVEEISINEIQDALKKVIERKSENIAESFLDEVNFVGKLRAHPLVGKVGGVGRRRVSVIDMGNLMRNIRRSEYYKKLYEKLTEISKQQVMIKDIVEIKDLLEGLKSKAIDFIVKQIGTTRQGLRHFHAPGSVAKSEGRNLYFPGEKYTQEILYQLASRLCNSIALGNDIGIYSENEDLMIQLKQLAYQKFKSKFKIELKDLDISEDEANHPFAVLLGFTLWLVKLLLIEEKHEIRTLIQSILDNLKTSAISLFFMPQKEVEKWSTISLPRLDIFVEKWVLNKESRDKIEALRRELKHFITAAREEAEKKGKVEEVKKTIDLLMSNYDAFCRRLIEYGDLDFYVLRRVMDIIVDLGTRYGLKMHLKSLGSVMRC